jgi:hypothetical protein
MRANASEVRKTAESCGIQFSVNARIAGNPRFFEKAKKKRAAGSSDGPPSIPVSVQN